MKNRLAVVIALICFNVAQLSAADSDTTGMRPSGGRFRFNGYSGGMLLHTGYVQSRTFTLHAADGAGVTRMRLRGAPLGIGGALRVRFGKHLRVPFFVYAAM